MGVGGLQHFDPGALQGGQDPAHDPGDAAHAGADGGNLGAVFQQAVFQALFRQQGIQFGGIVAVDGKDHSCFLCSQCNC